MLINMYLSKKTKTIWEIHTLSYDDIYFHGTEEKSTNDVSQAVSQPEIVSKQIRSHCS